MRNSIRTIHIVLLALGLIVAGCSDTDTLAPDPDAHSASVAVELETEAWGTEAPASHDVVRVRVLDTDGESLRTLSLNYSGDLSGLLGPWDVELEDESGASGQLEVEVLEGTRVLWSGRSDPVSLEAGASRTLALTLYPAGLDQRSLTGVSVTAPHDQLGIGEMWSLSVSGSGATLQGGFWGSLDPGVAVVTADGEVEGLSEGVARIVHASGLVADTLSIATRELVESIEVTPDALEFSYLRESRDLSVVVRDFRGETVTDPQVDWSSDDPLVAGAEAGGRIVARGSGSTSVQASLGNVSTSVSVVVEQEPHEMLVLPRSTTVQLGQSLQVNASLRDRGGAVIPGVEFDFDSANPDVVSIEANGRVRGESVGETTVTVLGGGFSREIEVVVVAGAASRIQLVSGGNQTAAVDTQLPEPVHVRVIDGSGFPVPDRQVTWVASDDGAVEAVGSSTTDSNGELRVRWRLGIALGTQTVTAFADDATPLEVEATATPGPAARVVKIGGDQQSGPVASELSMAATVEVRDAFGFAVSGATLQWSPSGTGTVAPGGSTQTASDGRTEVRWTLGTSAGTQRLGAALPGIDEVEFRADALPGTPVSVEIVPASVEIDPDEVITLEAVGVDVYGNSVPDLAADWSSDDLATAQVGTNSGILTGIWEGSTTVEAEFDGMTAQASVEVRTVMSHGGFEDNGGAGTRDFTGWMTEQTPSSSRGWLVQNGTSSPLTGFTLPVPPEGSFASLSDQTGSGYSILYREVYIPEEAGTLEFELLYDNSATDFATPESFDVTSDNQQFRVDLMDPGSGTQDFGGAILLMAYRTDAGDPLDTGGAYVPVSVDVSAVAGQVVRLRFIQTDSAANFRVAIDDVRLERAP